MPYNGRYFFTLINTDYRKALEMVCLVESAGNAHASKDFQSSANLSQLGIQTQKKGRLIKIKP